jgi:hypothetical protein
MITVQGIANVSKTVNGLVETVYIVEYSDATKLYRLEAIDCSTGRLLGLEFSDYAHKLRDVIDSKSENKIVTWVCPLRFVTTI